MTLAAKTVKLPSYKDAFDIRLSSMPVAKTVKLPDYQVSHIVKTGIKVT